MGRIVVGVDGSEHAKEALAWAAEEARLRSATLEVLCCYHIPAGWLGVGDGSAIAVTTPVAVEDLESHATETVNRAVADVVGERRPPELQTTTIMGHPADALVDASKGADLLVVGNRGRGDLGSVLLGSVGMHCVHHAHCPVVVVRPPEHK